jgi:hypothetical protein
VQTDSKQKRKKKISVDRKKHTGAILANQTQIEPSIVLSKLRTIIAYANSSPNRSTDWKILCSKHNIPPRCLKRDNATRWGSSLRMIEGVLLTKPAIMEISSSCGIQLTDDDWKMIHLLCDLLAKFNQHSLVLQSSNPTIQYTISIFNIIYNLFDDVLESPNFASLRIPLLRGLKKWRKYYKLTDNCTVHLNSVLLNPSLKKDYFYKNEWPEDQISSILEK